jgi:hypothetical protein
MNTGIELIAAERERHGWTIDHDNRHTAGELIAAATCYADASLALINGAQPEDVRGYYLDCTAPVPQWPWDDSSFKISSDPIRNLVKAGALIAAEIDRISRQNESQN